MTIVPQKVHQLVLRSRRNTKGYQAVSMHVFVFLVASFFQRKSIESNSMTQEKSVCFTLQQNNYWEYETTGELEVVQA